MNRAKMNELSLTYNRRPLGSNPLLQHASLESSIYTRTYDELRYNNDIYVEKIIN
jgi:hypothetical protein